MGKIKRSSGLKWALKFICQKSEGNRPWRWRHNFQKSIPAFVLSNSARFRWKVPGSDLCSAYQTIEMLIFFFLNLFSILKIFHLLYTIKKKKKIPLINWSKNWKFNAESLMYNLDMIFFFNFIISKKFDWIFFFLFLKLKY